MSGMIGRSSAGKAAPATAGSRGIGASVSWRLKSFGLRAVVLSIAAIVAGAGCGGARAAEEAGAPATRPSVNRASPDFSLPALDGKTLRLSELARGGPVVLVVLRGWPGYQCPICTRQAGDFLSHAADLRAAGGQVVFVYPGPADGLDAHAREFLSGKDLPEGFWFVTDPGLKFVTAWGLRWDAKGETAYPATFVIDKDNVVRFAQVSRSHGGRATVDQVLKALQGAGR